MRIVLFSFILLALAAFPTAAQSLFTPADYLINGYAGKKGGLDFEYHSCIPGLRQSLLMRATNGKDFVEWETEAVPAGIKTSYATFVWIAALGSSPGRATMHLAVDGEPWFSFFTDGKPHWEYTHANGSKLSFHSIMVDQYGDHHGYMVLRLPAALAKPGKPLLLKATGSEANLTSWYMTFKKEVKTGVTLNAFPAILKKEKKQLVEAGIFYFGKNTKAKVYADGKLLAETPLAFGYNTVNLGLPPVDKPTQVDLKVVAGDFEMNNRVVLEPVRKWALRFIQHTHTDIGYTRSQTEILAEHLRYIDYALDYCDATDDYPENARFRWTCEAAWAVDEYLQCRPWPQVKRLIERVKEGRIEMTGMYFNFDELPDEQILAASLQAVGRIRDKGIPVELAMQNDVNGIGWGLNDYYQGLGIRYLNMGTHGHRALICFDRPTMFWWESPSGKRMLAFRAEHYMTGNTVMEIHTGDIAKFQNHLFNYLMVLGAKGYPFDEMAIQHSGYLTDNSPPSTIASDLIRQWNETFEWPKLTTSTALGFFREMEEKHSAAFPVIRGAWPDWWTDGFGAAARETAATRAASASLTAGKSGLSMAAIAGLPLPSGIDQEIELAEEALLFYTEHTTGYSESVREPFHQQTMEQRALKESYAWEARRRAASIQEQTLGVLQTWFAAEADPTLLAFNPLNWNRSGLVTVYIDHQLVPRGSKAGIFDQKGKRMPAQPVSHRADGTYWAVWLDSIPAFGYKKFTLRALEDELALADPQGQPVLENRWYKVEADPARGAIRSWLDKDLGEELADPAAPYQLGEFILEQLSNREQMEARRLDDFRRLPLDTVWFDSKTEGEVWSTLRFYGESETAIGPRGFMMEVRLFHPEKRLELAFSLVKKSIVEPESFYIAFPFRLEDGRHFTEVQGGVIETGVDQIPGSASDWYTVQSFTAVRNADAQILMSSPEAPLMQFGAINTGRYQAGAMPQGPHLYSWPMNNYWVTNYNAEQRGGHSWSYQLTSMAGISAVDAARFGQENRLPMLTRVIQGGGAGDDRWEGSFLSGLPHNALLVSVQPASDGRSLFLHLRETAGRTAMLNLKNGLTGELLHLEEVDVTGKELEGGVQELRPLESRFFRVF